MEKFKIVIPAVLFATMCCFFQEACKTPSIATPAVIIPMYVSKKPIQADTPKAKRKQSYDIPKIIEDQYKHNFDKYFAGQFLELKATLSEQALIIKDMRERGVKRQNLVDSLQRANYSLSENFITVKLNFLSVQSKLSELQKEIALGNQNSSDYYKKNNEQISVFGYKICIAFAAFLILYLIYRAVKYRFSQTNDTTHP